MELRIQPFHTPDPISFNYDELKEALAQKVSHYETIVYTEDQFKDAKADRANLNKLKKALNDERIKQEKAYMVPFDQFKRQISEIIGIIDKAASTVDRQVKAFEDQKREEKRAKITEIWNSFLSSDRVPAGITLESVFDQKWLNATVSDDAVEKAMGAKLEQAANDLAVVANLPAYAFEAREVYFRTLDLGKAVSEAQRLTDQAEKRKEWEAEQERRKAAAEDAARRQVVTNINDPDDIENARPAAPNTSKQWVNFAALLSKEDAFALKDFFQSRNIEFKKI